MSIEQQLFDEFKRNLERFREAQELARRIETSTPSDDFNIKIAVAGFLFHSQPNNWGRNCYEFIIERRDDVVALSSDDPEGAFTPAYQAFLCLSLGALLGMFDVDKIDEDAFRKADLLLPGFMFLKLPEIEREFQLQQG